MEMKKKPRIGVGVIVKNLEGQVLLGKRKNAHGAGCWSFPGGHLEFGEAIEDCARREVEEETGLEVKELRRVGFTNDIYEEEGLHYVTLFLEGVVYEGVPELREPHKCEYRHCSFLIIVL